MQQVLDQLSNGELEVVGDDGQGILTYMRRPPTSLHLRAARLIKQLVAERDGMQTSYISQQSSLHDALLEIESLKLKLKLKEATNVSKNSTIPAEQHEEGRQSPSEAHDSASPST